MASGDGFTRPFVRRLPEWYFRQRQQRRNLRMGLEGHPIRVEQIASKEHLDHRWQRLATQGGKGAGVDGYTYADFSPSEVGQVVGDLSEQAVSGVYFAEKVRKVRIPKRPGSEETRELKIGTLCDRVLGSALESAFQGFWKKRFLPWSFGFRKGVGTWDMLADIEVAMQRTGMRVLAANDLKNAFDNVPIDIVLECHRDALEGVRQKNFGREERERTLALVEAVLRGHARKRQRGIDQGNPYSPTAPNVVLNEHHDRKIKTEISMKLLWWRYADNVAYLCQGMSEGEQALEEVGRLLEPLGMTLKGEDGVKDLSQGDVARLLGFSLWWDNAILYLEVEPETLDQLRQRLGQAHVTPNPRRAALDVVRGWVTAYAPAFEDADVSSVLVIISECGFREGISLALMEQWWQDAWERWQRCRQKARRRHGDPPASHLLCSAGRCGGKNVANGLDSPTASWSPPLTCRGGQGAAELQKAVMPPRFGAATGYAAFPTRRTWSRPIGSWYAVPGPPPSPGFPSPETRRSCGSDRTVLAGRAETEQSLSRGDTQPTRPEMPRFRTGSGRTRCAWRRLQSGRGFPSARTSASGT